MDKSDIKQTEFSTYLVDDEAEPCRYCGNPAYLIDIYIEARVCSEECCKKYYKQIGL